MWDHYKSLINENSTTTSLDNQNLVDIEFQNYFNEPLQPQNMCIFKYWKSSNRQILKLLAKKYLCIPAASVASERLFSTAGLICDRKRNRLDPRMARMLVFLNKNLP